MSDFKSGVGEPSNSAEGLGVLKIVKNVDRINRIETSFEEKLETEFCTWQICRLMRRDYYFLSTSLVLTLRRNKVEINRLLLELKDEALAMENLGRKYEFPSIEKSPIYIFRIVSNEARMLYDAMMMMDRPFAKLKGTPDEEEAERIMLNFFTCIGNLRALFRLATPHKVENQNMDDNVVGPVIL